MEWVENAGMRVVNETYITTNNDLLFGLKYVHVQFPTEYWYLTPFAFSAQNCIYYFRLTAVLSVVTKSISGEIIITSLIVNQL